MSVKIFLSTVSDEFRHYRDLLRTVMAGLALGMAGSIVLTPPSGNTASSPFVTSPCRVVP
jgi:hypothetical protein